MRHAARVLMPAMEQQDGALAAGAGRRPAAEIQLDAVVGTEAPLDHRAQLGSGEIGGVLVHLARPRSDPTVRPQGVLDACLASASARPLRTRLTMVRTSSRPMSGIAHAAQAGSCPASPSQSPRTPKPSARSLLPAGPS